MLYHFEATEDLNSVKVDSIKTDLDTALTFVQIARQTSEREKSIRNRRNARQAYDVVLRYIDSASLNGLEREHLTKKLASLKSALLSLGESF